MIIQTKHLQRGLSLVELMVAVTLSMVLMLGIFQIFSSSKQTSRAQDALARVQENARFALDLLTHDIRMAGQLGCNNSITVSNISVSKSRKNLLYPLRCDFFTSLKNPNGIELSISV